MFSFGSLFFLLYGGVILVYLIVLVGYLFPFLQGLISVERQNWVRKFFADNPGENESDLGQRIQLAAAPEQAQPFYKFLKFYLIAAGIVLFVTGIIIFVFPEEMSDNGRKILSLVPAIVGVGFYFLYKKVLKKETIWRELAGFLLLAGVAASWFAVYNTFALDEYLRSDFYLYVILGFGLFVMHHLNSIAASYLYMVLVIIGSSFVTEEVGDNWMYFMTLFIWFFALGILSFWLPRLRETKEIEANHVAFGALFFGMMISLSINNLAGLPFLGLSVMIPCLYLFSKKHFQKATWIGARPIELNVGVGIVAVALCLSIPELISRVGERIDLFQEFSFYRLVAIFIIIIIGLVTYVMYNDQLEVDKKKINMLVLFGPIGAFVLTYALKDAGGHYLINLYLLALGFYLLHKGSKDKNVVNLIAASFIIIAAIAVRLYDIRESLENKEAIGGIVMFFGLLFSGMALYMHHKWNENLLEDDPNNPVITEISEDDLLDV